MYGIKNITTDKWVGLFFHTPKTGGSNIIHQLKSDDAFDIHIMTSVLPFDETLLKEMPVNDEGHLTIDQAFKIFPTLDDWIDRYNIDVFTLTRDPYERFISCMRFLPTAMRLNEDSDGISFYESLTPSEFHRRITTTNFSPQSYWNCRDGKPFARRIRLEDIIGQKKVHLCEECYVDFTQTIWSLEQASEQIHDNSYVIPKFTLDEETKKFVQWLWKDDFKNPLVR